MTRRVVPDPRLKLLEDAKATLIPDSPELAAESDRPSEPTKEELISMAAEAIVAVETIESSATARSRLNSDDIEMAYELLDDIVSDLSQDEHEQAQQQAYRTLGYQ